MASGEHTITIRTELDNAVVIKPGGALVVGLKRRIDMAEAARIKDHIEESLPGVNVVILDGIDHMAVYAPPDYKLMASQVRLA